ncbi:S-layer homology domain-containing protein [Deinococcus sp. RIT780]|uniref:S-layer homology domain-containing protein n=1 Tax=Deinococcus sp. RIT780 TaxID=2870472 RepID=UPI001C89F76F|nr:S-layer homology domain-containing protein [Deinococcus sp. RIT780]MBX8465230.1 S-layer homology domain-containing protein [Deinococcus sp. RIT780]
MRKSLIIASTLALSLGAASAQTATTTAAPAQVTLSDVPAGHWAKDAVDRIVQCGLIQGYPDGTYRGNQNLTRYEAALIFYRALQTGALSNCGLSQEDMTAVANGMQEVSTELAAIASRVTDLEKLTADQQARIDALEAKIEGMGAGAASTDTAAMTARIDALEAAIRNIPAGPQGPAGPAGPAGPVGPQGPAGPAGTSASGTVTTTPTTPATGTVVIGDTAPATSMAQRDLYVGINGGVKGAATGSECRSVDGKNTAVGYCFSGGAVIGKSNVIGPVGVRVAGDYQPGWNAISGDVSATYDISTGSNLTPYVGAGLGLTSSQKRGDTTKNESDVYVNAVLGADYRITDSISAYVEGGGKYYLSNKGYGTGLATADKSGFNLGAKAGVKFFF